LASDDEEYEPDITTTPPSPSNLKQSKSISPHESKKSENQSETTLKRRLGPIPKKNRSSTSTQGTPSSSKLTGTPNPASTLTSQQPSRPAPSGAARKLHNSSTDVDLRDASVYMNLFRMTKSNTAKSGNSTSRPNISRNAHREKNPNRRAELARLRDEDRERRMMIPMSASLLYEQHAQMSRFELRLRARNSAAAQFGPNVLGAAFRNWGPVNLKSTEQS